MRYTDLVKQFKGISPEKVHGAIKVAKTAKERYGICDQLKLHPDGLQGIFESGQLSLSSAGYIEPLLPPMRHPNYCFNSRTYLLNMDYLVHDFEYICKKLLPTSRTVLFDLGASLKREENPVMTWLVKQYQKFGINFDHIYAFEIVFETASNIYSKLLPQEFFASYHWINTGVSPKKGDKMNPWDSFLRKYNEDDFIVVKLDVDTSSIELPLVQQILNDKSLSKLIDVFYFEHHVFAAPIAYKWGKSCNGTMQDTFEMFHALRSKHGVAAHFWI